MIAGEHEAGDAPGSSALHRTAASTMQAADRIEDPAGLAEVGDLVERVDQPQRQAAGIVTARASSNIIAEADEQQCPRLRQAPNGRRGGKQAASP